MATRAIPEMYGFLCGMKENPVFPFHTFPGFASQTSVNLQFAVTAELDFLFFYTAY